MHLNEFFVSAVIWKKIKEKLSVFKNSEISSQNEFVIQKKC